jgi:hypothetical protein
LREFDDFSQFGGFFGSFTNGLKKDSIVGLDTVYISHWFGSSGIPVRQASIIFLLP